MRIRQILLLTLIGGFIGLRTAAAQNYDASSSAAFAGVTFVTATDPVPLLPPLTRLNFDLPDQAAQPTQPATKRPMAFQYSDGYRTRAKIHRYASFAFLPIFITEGFVGQSLYNNPTESKKSAHLALATGMGTLFALNAVTGIWNMMEARKDPNGRTKRMAHGVLMLIASGGFLATAATAPHSELGDRGQFEGGGGGDGGSGGSRSLHRGLAFTSIGLATASYLIMLFGK
jgi:hypothetical protein